MNLRNLRFRNTLLALALSAAFVSPSFGSDQVRTTAGIVEGRASTDGKILIFEGIPYAAPPDGDLRWKAPQPPANWPGVRKATEFGARCMQGPIYGDMNFRDNGPSEDCLYLNVWTPAKSAAAHLPVMVWIHGGGFVAGSSSEPRQDGQNLAKKGVVVVSFNYRLDIFGFFADSALAKESAHHAAGNYGLLDQVAALQWVKDNIAAFGGDPQNVTIFGESAGSFSVSALMATPLSRGLFHRAIGESGAFFGTSLPLATLADAEQIGAKFAKSIGAKSLADLRAIPAEKLLGEYLAAGKFAFPQDIDGYFLPDDVRSIFAAGKQARVPLLAGWNHDEDNFSAVFGKQAPTAKNFIAFARSTFGDRAHEFLKLYPANSDEEAIQSANDLAGDDFIAYSTWKWLEMQLLTGHSSVYRYEFDDAPPRSTGAGLETPVGAYHSAEIEFVFETLPSKNLPWRPGDFQLSDLISSYWTNFAKTGDPNNSGLPAALSTEARPPAETSANANPSSEASGKAALPHWPAHNANDGYQVMHLSFDPHAAPDAHRSRYLFLDSLPPSR